MTRRRKLTVVTSYPIFPPRGGGQQRIHGLFGAVAREGVDVDIVALADAGDRARTTQLAPDFRQFSVPKSREHSDAELELSAAAGIPVTDLAMAAFFELTPALGRAFALSARDSDVVIASHPYGTPMILAAGLDRPLVYDSHNVELDLKEQMLAGRVPKALDIVRDCERRSYAEATMVVTCAEADGARLGELYGGTPRRIVCVPNGCDRRAQPFVDTAERQAARASVGLEQFIVLFVGSWHEPNLEAGRFVIAAARGLPDVRMLIVGSAGSALAAEDELPPNVDATGPVVDGFLQDALSVASVAVNPMRSGSGTNLKMLNYALAGVPLVSSEFGARGLGFVAGEHYVLGEPEALAATLERVRAEDPAVHRHRASLAYERVTSTFDWPVIARRWLAHEAMRELLGTS